MKKVLLLALVLFMGISARVKAADTDISKLDNVVYISPLTAEAGTTVELSVKMKNNAYPHLFSCIPLFARRHELCARPGWLPPSLSEH